jgi:hypothetical protein
MATNDTAALVVALSAQLTKFEKDMKGAVDIADQVAPRRSRRLHALEQHGQRQAVRVSSACRAISVSSGQLLVPLGPLGIAAAVGSGDRRRLRERSLGGDGQFAEKAKVLKEAAETAGLTITQFKLLGGAGKTVGLDFDETSAFSASSLPIWTSCAKAAGRSMMRC